MAATMDSLFLVLIFFVSSAVCKDSIHFSHVPSFMRVEKSEEKLPLSQLQDVVTAGMGFTPSTYAGWRGLSRDSMFSRPKANLLVVVSGSPAPHTMAVDNHILLSESSADVELSSLHHKMELAYVEKNLEPLIVELGPTHSVRELIQDHPDIFQRLPVLRAEIERELQSPNSVMSLDGASEVDATDPLVADLLAELQLVWDVVGAVEKYGLSLARDEAPDSFVLHVTGLAKLASSPHLAAAHQLMQQALDKAMSRLSSLYGGDLLAEVVSLKDHAPSVRLGRRLLQANAAAATGLPRNQAYVYDALFPVTFNIVLFLSIFVILLVIFVSSSMWYMDPGKDSIIYRMTTQRLKKD